MKISTVKVTALRSISEATIDRCGDLNVLIGRNNSGKSNLLFAIKTFFDFLRQATLIASADPSIGASTDWFDRNDSTPATIKMSLTLTSDEAESVLNAIAAQVPQMRNALTEVRKFSEIECELTFYRTPKPIGFVSRIALTEEGGQSVGRTVFEVERAAAEEIASRDLEVKELTAQINAIEHIDPDDWPVIREKRLPLVGTVPRSVYSALSEDQIARITRLIRNAESAEELQGRIETLKAEFQERKSSLLSAENVNSFETFSGEAQVVPSYVSMIAGLIGDLKVHNLSEQRQPIGQEEANRILQLKTRRGQGDVLQGIQERVAELLGVKIDAFSSDRQFLVSRPIPAELDVDDFLIQVNGSGIKEALRLMLDYEFARPKVLLVEEPEVHLHPALEIAMMQYLRKISDHCQIFLTTHSTNFLDLADLRNVYLVKRERSTSVQLLDVGEAEEAIPQELGIRLSSLFMYDRLVFVEGPSDEQILRTFAATLGINLSHNGIGFVTTGGARNFTHYASATTLTFLSKRRVKLFFVLDKDERDLPEIEKLRNQLGALGELKVLERREIENYLLDAAALSRYMREDRSLEPAPEESEISDVMVELAEELLETAVERRVLKVTCKPIIPDRSAVIDRGDEGFETALSEQLAKAEQQITVLKQGIDTLAGGARAELENLPPDNLLKLIPGDAVLDAIFKRYSLSFNKRKDAPKIASVMIPSEIPSEIRNLLIRIGG